MLLIISSCDDASTNDVLDWVYFQNPEKKIKRVNNINDITEIKYRISDSKEMLEINSNFLNQDTDQIDSYWYRRGAFLFEDLPNNSLYPKFGLKPLKYINRDMNFILSSLNFSLEKGARKINRPSDNETNKLKNLSVARSVGLAIPDSIICSDWNSLLSFSKENKTIITKPLVNGNFHLTDEDGHIISVVTGVEQLTYTDVQNLQQRSNIKSFLPSLFQKYIDKEFELRIFFLEGKCYSMAIFSQANELTKVDFRNYDYIRPNRIVPFQLPKQIEEKIIRFMHILGINCGSIDMIYSTEQKYVFLEVNPIGQYQWLTNACNYYLDKVISSYLLNSHS